MILDLRSMISRRRARGVEDFRQLLGFVLQCDQALRREEFGAFGDLQPQPRFIRLLEDDRDFVDEVSPRLSPERRALIGRDRAPASRHLVGHRPSRGRRWERIRQFQNADREPYRPFFELSRIHTPSYLGRPKQSSIIDHRS
jgi:hypothetical protein